MSILNEIARIKNAKAEVKSSIEKRGVTIAEDALVDSFADAVESAPYAVRGAFTPEVDTQVFSLSGLSFAPDTIYISCNELFETQVDNSLCVFVHGNGIRGLAMTRINDTTGTATLSPASSLVQWNSDSCVIDLSKSSGSLRNIYFKAGYTFEYYVTGGFSR